MKGPYERLKYSMQRVWECPDCKHHERTGGDVTGLVCQCQLEKERRQQLAMRLAEDGIRRVT